METRSDPAPESYSAERADQIITAFVGLEGGLLPALHALQATFGHVPKQAIPRVARAFDLSRAEVHGVVSFYSDFRSEPALGARLKLCRAEACQARGAEALARAIFAKLDVQADAEQWGGCSGDGRVTVEGVFCLGLCPVGPAAMVDKRLVGRADAELLLGLLPS